MNRRFSITLATVLFLLAGTYLLSADPQERVVHQLDEETAMLMRSKLVSSQNVLEGLLRKDFDRVSRGAREMRRISEAAEWPRARDEVYEHFGMEFRRQCRKLDELAKVGNHEGATFIYLNMTNTCISCHDYMRDALQVAAPGLRGDVQLIPSQWPVRENQVK